MLTYICFNLISTYFTSTLLRANKIFYNKMIKVVFKHPPTVGNCPNVLISFNISYPLYLRLLRVDY